MRCKEIRRQFLSEGRGVHDLFFLGAISSLASRLRCLRLPLVVHTLADRDVSRSSGLIELPAAVLALDVIAGIAGRRGWQIVQILTRRQSCLRLPRVADRTDELLVLAPPVRLRLRLLRFRLKTVGAYELSSSSGENELAGLRVNNLTIIEKSLFLIIVAEGVPQYQPLA